MIAKVFAIFCLLGLASAGFLSGGYGGYGSYGGYGGYGSYGGYAAVAPTYSYAPVVAKAVIPYAPAVSHVSQYSVHSAPLIKSYTPIVKSYAPVSYAYAAPAYGHSGYGSYGYGGYGNKYGW